MAIRQQVAPADLPVRPPFTVEQLKEDMCAVFLLEARKRNHLFDGDPGWATLTVDGMVEPARLFNVDLTPQEAGLTFEKIERTYFAQAMLDHYDFGFLAITGTRTEAMDWDSVHTYYAAHLLDLSKSVYVEEWVGEGGSELEQAIERCLHTIQISNARLILEGYVPFCNKFGNGSEGGDSEGELSIPQLAMLAGIEEVSLRSAISRKTAPMLRIEKDERRTYVASEVAKEWLKAKNRYIPVRIGRSTANLDLAQTAFKNTHHLMRALDDRLGFLCDQEPAKKDRMTAVLKAHGKPSVYDLMLPDLKNAQFMAEIAEVLELPPDLLAFRSKEAALATDIEVTQMELRQLRTSRTSGG